MPHHPHGARSLLHAEGGRLARRAEGGGGARPVVDSVLGYDDVGDGLTATQRNVPEGPLKCAVEEEVEVRDEEVKMAEMLIDNLTSTFDPTAWHDESREAA